MQVSFFRQRLKGSLTKVHTSPILLYHRLGQPLLIGRSERRGLAPSSLHLLTHPRTVVIKKSVKTMEAVSSP